MEQTGLLATAGGEDKDQEMTVDSEVSKGWTTTWISGGSGLVSASNVVAMDEPNEEKSSSSTDAKVATTENETVIKSENQVAQNENQSSFKVSTTSLDSQNHERKPKAAAKQDGKIEEVPPLQPLQSEEEDGCPSNWATDGWSGPDGFYLIKLRTHIIDYRSIYTEFVKQVENYRIVQIERIENRDSWDKYLFEKQRMLRNRPQGSGLNECYLYHGTIVEKQIIASEGLDMRRGKIGFFGRGIYLSNNINKCLQYTSKRTDKSALPYVLKCRVLLGDSKVYEKGQTNPDLVTEPIRENPRPGESKYYDSVKGNVLGHDEYVVYNNVRVMPEYIVTYTEKSAEDSPNNSIKINTTLPKLKSKTSLSSVARNTEPESTQTWKTTAVSTVDDGESVAMDTVNYDVDSKPSGTGLSGASSQLVGTRTEQRDTVTEPLSNEFAQSLQTNTDSALSHEVWETQKAELSHELRENVQAAASAATGSQWRSNQGELSHEVLQSEYSEELKQNEEAMAKMERDKDNPETTVMGQRLTWGPPDPEDHDRKLEAVRNKLQKKHRRYKGFKQPEPEKQTPAEQKVVAKSHDEQIEEVRQIMRGKHKKEKESAATSKPKEDNVQTDAVDDVKAIGESTMTTDKQALQIREYLKKQHKSLQLRRADEQSIGKVESLLVAYYQTYGSIDSPGMDPTAIPPLPKGDASDTQGTSDVQTQDVPQQGILARGLLSGPELSQSNNNTITGQTLGIEEDDPVSQVMNKLVDQFKECTGTTDDAIAVEYIKKANMDINEAILRYVS